ncbi:hypothetical protein EI555_006343 [Monodon monoceros]|uniref:Uncharacterized protein n=1 Tax=Monodon monoceros TaxID=40151 RepID=A0A4U1FE79_MONMO|nr:hypothetical protein EI555_006343 [Monodon monoceros]
MQTVQHSEQTQNSSHLKEPSTCVTVVEIGSPPILRLPKTFKSFSNDPYRKIPSPEKCSIYLQCIGSLGNTRIFRHILKFLKEKGPEDAFCAVEVTIGKVKKRYRKYLPSGFSAFDNYYTSEVAFCCFSPIRL